VVMGRGQSGMLADVQTTCIGDLSRLPPSPPCRLADGDRLLLPLFLRSNLPPSLPPSTTTIYTYTCTYTYTHTYTLPPLLSGGRV